MLKFLLCLQHFCSTITKKEIMKIGPNLADEHSHSLAIRQLRNYNCKFFPVRSSACSQNEKNAIDRILEPQQLGKL